MRFRVIGSCAVAVLAGCSAVAIGGYAIAAPHGRSSSAAQLTGRQLSALLVPLTDVPRGYETEKNLVHDSGSRLEVAAARYDLATMSCAAINDDNGRAGFGESAFAEAGFTDLPGLSGSGLSQQVYQFRTARSAASYWRGLRAIIIRCPGQGAATEADPGKITQRVLAVRYGNDQAFEADMTDTLPQYGPVNMAMLVVAAGDDVFTTDITGYNRPVPDDPTARALMSELVARVQAPERL